MKFFILLLVITHIATANAQTLLEAKGLGGTYELVNSVLAPNGGNVVESPDCAHPAFGRHITEVWDSELNEFVFAFHIHVTPDNDRCTSFDRQRMEIKTYGASPAHLKTVQGETVEYKWKFRLPVGFQPSSSFTHIHQIKAVGGDDGDPIFTLTPRYNASRNKMELIHNNSNKVAIVDLSLFEGNWVEVTQKIFVSATNGSYSIVIKNIKTDATILSYSNNNIMTIRASNNYIRPKWGVYRSLNNKERLRDEIVLFNSFSIHEQVQTASSNITQNGLDSFSVRQNAVSNQLEISYNAADYQQAMLQILNTNGQVVHVIKQLNLNKGKQKIKLDLPQLSSNLYFVRLLTNTNAVTQKLLLMH